MQLVLLLLTSISALLYLGFAIYVLLNILCIKRSSPYNLYLMYISIKIIGCSRKLNKDNALTGRLRLVTLPPPSSTRNVSIA
jgi:hypothetical protein